MEDKRYTFKILMLKRDEELERKFLFMRYSRAVSVGGVDLGNYEEVYSGLITAKDNMPVTYVLEEIYRIFNVSHPKDYNKRSLSLSDIVAISPCDDAPGESTGYTYYYVDAFGFQKLTEVQPS